MAITTYSLISRQTVGSAGGVASITFSNIPQTFTDLKIVASGRTDYNGLSDESYVKLNGSSASIYSWVLAYSSGTASAAATDSAEGYGIPGCQNNAVTSTANVFCNGEIYIPNYASANYKRISLEYGIENNATATNLKAMTSGLWGSTAAVTSVSLSGQLGNYVQYSTFSLYGISSNTTTQNTSVPSATGGDVITTDGTYWYHAFKYSGTFTPLKALTADCLVVAGGGGGGVSGGGGAGGFLTFSSQSFTATGYTVTVGAGGALTQYNNDSNNGSDSQLGSLTLVIGGGGGGKYNQNGHNGGSGGGGSHDSSTTRTGGTATSGQGNAGGSNSISSPYSDGGGGGAGAVGANASGSTAGNGGVGSSSAISGGATTAAGQLSGSTYYFSGGGGGSIHNNTGTTGSGGLGGGASAPGSPGAGVAGTANTGGGGSGAGRGFGAVGPSTSGAGGSGIVIVRYAV